MNYLALAAGVFVGNFLIHTFKGDPFKGICVGSIAAVIVLAVGGIMGSGAFK